MKQHDGLKFTTKDQNNGIGNDNCAAKLNGGWWFHNCHSALLTGPYFSEKGRTQSHHGILWFSWKEAMHLKAAQMKIRPKLYH